ncbi:IPT/TIG domain-containing protein [Actinoplanes sp. CA-051413]|uniref:IPT/TIG domain-containing protein n=1 Tax=Actinoplanes sp. CA-051413 TaxID=3239899 RepID=UPI003D982856
MSKSMSTTRSRLARAGFATGAVAAVLLGTTTPAFAAGAVTIDDATGVTGLVETITASSSTQFGTSGTIAANFSTASVCPTASTANATNIAATNVVRVTSSSVTMSTPATLVPAVYKVCVYSGGTLVNNPTTTPIYTVSAATPALNLTTGPAGGGNQITATSANPFLTVAGTTPGVVFSVPTCPAVSVTADATHVSASAVTVSNDKTTATITVPSGVVAPNTYNVCIYKATTVGSDLIGNSSNDYVAGAPEVTLSAVTGPNGGGNTLTTTAAAFADLGATVPAVNFSTTACSTTYENTGPAAALAAPATRASNTVSFVVPAGVLAPDQYNVCIYAGNTDGTSPLVAQSSAKYSIPLAAVTTSPDVGASATNKTITITSSSPILSGVTAPGVTFSVTACLPTYTVDGTHFAADGTPKRITDNIASMIVPTTVVVAGGVPTAYNVCLYNGTAPDSTLVSNAGTYTVAGAVTLANSPLTVATSGPAQGGTLVTVSGTGFPTGAGAITASLGGSELKNIKRLNGTTFTGVTTAHAPGVVGLSVTTAAGTLTKANVFTYSYGITVLPNTAPSDTTVDLYITGAGFSELTFADTAGGDLSDNDEAHVYLVDGAYSAADNSVPGTKNNPPVAECEDAFALSDTALLCSLNLEEKLNAAGAAQPNTPVSNGTYTVAVVNTGLPASEAAANNPVQTVSASILTSGSTFTVAQY